MTLTQLKHSPYWLSAICGASVAANIAGAQSDDRGVDRKSGLSAEDKSPVAPMPLGDGNYDRVYEGWYVDSIVDRPIYGPHGDEIGSVKNLLLNPDGEIVALIAEVGGFWDIGDTHVTIPWRAIERRDGKTYSPITVETAENYAMFTDEIFTREDNGNITGVDESVETGPYIWKATALLDDYVVLGNGEPFGYVTDLVFNDADKLISVVAVEARGSLDERGVFAFPWDNRGWWPGLDHYTLRHTADEISGLPTIDYSEFDPGA
jgi:sporulation protein YlmC with PRC-barrel domain